MPLTVTVEGPDRDREVLASWLRSTSIRAGLAQRARHEARWARRGIALVDALIAASPGELGERGA